jgi:hypothetical protein
VWGADLEEYQALERGIEVVRQLLASRLPEARAAEQTLKNTSGVFSTVGGLKTIVARRRLLSRAGYIDSAGGAIKSVVIDPQLHLQQAQSPYIYAAANEVEYEELLYVDDTDSAAGEYVTSLFIICERWLTHKIQEDSFGQALRTGSIPQRASSGNHHLL